MYRAPEMYVTTADVLRELRSLFLGTSLSLDKLKERFEKAGRELANICLEDLEKVREKLKYEGKEWLGTHKLTGHLRLGEDGIAGEGESVEIGEKIRFVSRGVYTSYAVGIIKEIDFEEWVISGDGNCLERLFSQTKKAFEENGRFEEIVLRETTVELQDNVVVGLAILQNLDRPPSPGGSFYYKPRNMRQRFEIHLPR